MTDYPDSPGVRAGSPDTAFEAADDAADAAKSREAMALKFIRGRGLYGATADEVADTFGWERYSSRPRLSTLRAQSKIVDGGGRREGASGRRQAVWIAAEYAPPLEREQGEFWEAAE
ncbi:hypothetical protein GCM10011371_18330 [Novosphingobium marinum]|uniref:Uncharacterized protein n=1 Tax=Novosphingobium marinum TaxID=1514948 RepID=A0A7Z0BW18_9SPHN|nr:hypothetical protein [Novosphingobium marinum]NYH95945.1 hypothetical protein [Novosphingobium marinum]GGC31234.1 hypothetical protein GCM10011371_18330 [Novosphingobium marinum]